MKYQINSVMCDTFAHVDQRKVGETVRVSVSNIATHTIIAFLYCDNHIFPVSKDAGLAASCCIRHNGGKTTAECYIGNNGEVIIPLPEFLCTNGQNLLCEINITGTSDGNSFRYRAFEFRAAIVP